MQYCISEDVAKFVWVSQVEQRLHSLRCQRIDDAITNAQVCDATIAVTKISLETLKFEDDNIPLVPSTFRH